MQASLNVVSRFMNLSDNVVDQGLVLQHQNVRIKNGGFVFPQTFRDVGSNCLNLFTGL